MFGRVYLTQSNLIMVLVVEDIHKIGVERVDVVQFRKLGYDTRELVMEILLSVLDLPSVELPYS